MRGKGRDPRAREGRHGLWRSSTEDHLHLLLIAQSLFLPFLRVAGERNDADSTPTDTRTAQPTIITPLCLIAKYFCGEN